MQYWMLHSHLTIRSDCVSLLIKRFLNRIIKAYRGGNSTELEKTWYWCCLLTISRYAKRISWLEYRQYCAKYFAMATFTRSYKMHQSVKIYYASMLLVHRQARNTQMVWCGNTVVRGVRKRLVNEHIYTYAIEPSHNKHIDSSMAVIL